MEFGGLKFDSAFNGGVFLLKVNAQCLLHIYSKIPFWLDCVEKYFIIYIQSSSYLAIFFHFFGQISVNQVSGSSNQASATYALRLAPDS